MLAHVTATAARGAFMQFALGANFGVLGAALLATFDLAALAAQIHVTFTLGDFTTARRAFVQLAARANLGIFGTASLAAFALAALAAQRGLFAFLSTSAAGLGTFAETAATRLTGRTALFRGALGFFFTG